MSERGSFTTEYVYCRKCFKAIQPILLGNGKWLCSRVCPAYWDKEDNELGDDFFIPIISGKIGGNYPRNEFVDFLTDYGPRVEEVICHPLRIAVLADNGRSELYTFKPGGDGD